MKTFNEKVYELRKESRLSQEEVAEQLNVSRQTISNWENGTAQPALDKAVELAYLFDVSLDELVGKTVQQTNKQSPILAALVGQSVTLYLDPVSDAWISVSKTEVKHCEVIAVNANNLKVIIQERTKRVERLFFLRDIIGFKKESE